MPRKYTHELNKEVQSISGWYRLYKEGRIGYKGTEFLYLVGDGVVESSCCGSGGCRYAVVPGFIVSWKSGANEEGLFTSVIEPIRDARVREDIQMILSKKEGISQVQFW